MLIDATSSCLLIVDVQAKLLPKMAAREEVVANAAVLLKAARRIAVPVLVSEQYTRGLGATVPELRDLLPENAIVEKMSFSCLGEPAFCTQLDRLQRRQAVVAGIEAHVCVLQTVEGLLEQGIQTFVVADAVSSRAPADCAAALGRLARSGAEIVTTEMVVFEWLARAGTPEFKELSALIK
jgi:nicotinamidase-related amidase